MTQSITMLFYFLLNFCFTKILCPCATIFAECCREAATTVVSATTTGLTTTGHRRRRSDRRRSRSGRRRRRSDHHRPSATISVIQLLFLILVVGLLLRVLYLEYSAAAQYHIPGFILRSVIGAMTGNSGGAQSVVASGINHGAKYFYETMFDTVLGHAYTGASSFIPDVD